MLRAINANHRTQHGSTMTKRADRSRNRRQKSPKMMGQKLYQQTCKYRNRLLRDITCKEDNTNFVCMATEDFEHLLNIFAPIMKNKDTYREILEYLLHIPKHSIFVNVSEVCDALMEVLTSYIKCFTCSQIYNYPSPPPKHTILPPQLYNTPPPPPHNYLQVPSSEEAWLKVSEDFERKWNFLHALGAMDSKHVMIWTPWYSGTEYHNYKNIFGTYNNLWFGRCQLQFPICTYWMPCTNLRWRQLNVRQPQILQYPYAIEFSYMILADQVF
ncbi:hypothetical protein PR048_002625 [Dryococelus australis]|uniref:Uncharacterized protein n=1 Tax=Dryococelus australis TaxID=614101 RepID=A0ABQ9IM62_9NEOP|nr:hypothetical protein PR048_002625 [Dryococelus australis]